LIAGQRKPGLTKTAVLVGAMIWVLVIFMIVPEGFEYSASAMPTQGSMSSRLTWLALLAFGAIVTLRRPGTSVALLRQVNPYLLLFGLLATASIVWSIDPAVTIRRLLRVLTIFLDAMALSLLAWNTTRLQDVLRPILTIMLVGSIVFGLLEPKLAIEQLNQAELVGAWHGLATQKNGLGSLAGTGVILWLHAWLARESKWWFVIVGAGAAVSCLLLSRSSTSLMASIFACVLLVMLLRSPPSLRRYMPYLIAVFVCLLLLYSLAVLNLVPGLQFVLKPITALTGKDQSFSGRTAIWAIISEHIAYNPLFGTGYGAYWVGEGVVTSPSYVMLQRLYFYPTEGHNGYLDVINDLGAVGGLCLLGYLLTYLRQGLRLYKTVRTQGALYLAILFQQLIANLSESRWFNVLSIEFVIVTLATVSMARFLLQQQLERKAAVRAARAASVTLNRGST
jgi:exopolysaccharide production protein ExoQ